MYPEITIGSLTIGSYTVFMILSVLISFFYFVIFSKRYGISHIKGSLIGVTFVCFGFLSGKVMFLLENLNSFEINYLLFSGGFSFFGDLFFLPIFLALYCFLSKENILNSLDFYSIGLFIFLSIFRIGCLLGGCCYGVKWNWGININGVIRFPVQIFEIIFPILFIILLTFLRNYKVIKKGEQFFLSLALYGLLRFSLEFLRDSTRVILNLSIAHFYSIVAIILGISSIIIYRYLTTKKII